ncbi:MAG: NUDIX domain-containing protein [Bacteroidales bacterium]|jgi:8-oxo-dGTP diphosphatase|nr:NUDIX domain-containing protein [Bacteroidales bacterium]
MKESLLIDNLSIDCVIFGFDEGKLKALFIKRNTEPCKGMMSLPGGFVYVDEDLTHVPARRLKDLTGLKNVFLREVGAFGKIDRYPERRVITIGYYALINSSDYKLDVGADAQDVRWISVDEVPELPFDHTEIFDAALIKLRKHVRYEPIGYNLLPEKFTITQLQTLYEAILNKKIDNRNFRKKLAKIGILKDLKEKQKNVSHRAANLYSFNKKKYETLVEKGYTFDF